ncbi:hypothetical protein CsSME_00037421 [Camellia sinensis var. sinensis]
MQDTEDRGFKEGKETYVQQCEAVKDIFFKCGWKAIAKKLGYGHDSEIFLNLPPYFILRYMTDYANAVQQKFLQEGEEDEVPIPHNAPPSNTQLGRQSVSPTPMDSSQALRRAIDEAPVREPN